MSDEITTVEAAGLLNCWPAQVRRFKLDGRIKASRMVANTLLFRRSEIERFAKTWTRKSGPPKRCK